MTTNVRARGEGSIFPYKNGRYAGYVWITTLSGERRRKYVYADTCAEVPRDDADPLYVGYVVLLCLGLRRGELLGLHWDDVDLDAATVHVHRELQRVDGRLVLSETKTLDSDAGLPLPPLCLDALRAHRAAQASAIGDRGFVTSNRCGGPLDPRNFYRSFQRRAARAAIPRIPLHGTRHTCASLLVEFDVHPRVAMQILRNAKIATTMDIYSHVPTHATRAAVSQIGGILGAHLPSDTCR